MKNNPQLKDFLIGKIVPRFPNHVVTEYIGRGANGYVFLAKNSSTSSSLAYKIIPTDNLPDNEEQQDKYLDEARKANEIEHACVVKCIDAFQYSDGEIQALIFVYNYVNGKNLRDYVKQNPNDVNILFIESFLRTMFGLLYELQQRGFPHGDLHAGNVLVAKSKYDIENRTTFRVTDFGVQQLSGKYNIKNDYVLVAETLNILLQYIKYQDCDGRDRYAYDVLRNELSKHLTELDVSADDLACNPSAMLEKLNSIDHKYQNSVKGSEYPKLVTPFDYPNCEQIGNSHLLLKNLYSDRLLGLSEIHARSNLVLTGPRGCGKTTVFRALSIEYLTSVGGDDPSGLRYIGIYYRCDDLYFNFPRYKKPERSEALNIPMHFLIVTLLATMLEQLSIWARKYYSVEFEKKEKTLASNLWDILGLKQPGGPNTDQLVTLVNKLKGERKRSARKQRFANDPTHLFEGYLGPGSAIESCNCIRKHFSFLEERPFYFFVDDYSDPKITEELQENLNRLLMFRSSDVFFKISTESPVSFARRDVDGKEFIETREYDLLNLGLRYLIDGRKHGLKFFEDLFQRRFQEVTNYPVQTLKELLGSKKRNENDAARSLIKEFNSRKKYYYAGCETLAAMCSGDIHYMIRLVSKMVEDIGGTEILAKSQNVPKIHPKQQNNTIRKTTGEFMESIGMLPGTGQDMANVIIAFGKVARSYLLYETSKNQRGHPPHQASRIEPYDDLQISAKARKILKDLIRYSVLIEDPRGVSRRGKTVPRFYLRRYLIPHFHLTFSRRDSLQLENREIETLLCHPERFERMMELKSEDDAARRRGRDLGQKSVFENE